MNWPTWLSHNPVAWVGVANGIIDAAIAFGVPITDPEKLAVGALLGLISVLFVQSQVTSTAKLASLGVTITPVAQAATVASVALPVAPPPTQVASFAAPVVTPNPPVQP
jgi:hypothetical protein